MVGEAIYKHKMLVLLERENHTLDYIFFCMKVYRFII
jgi:hypothetical protein